MIINLQIFSKLKKLPFDNNNDIVLNLVFFPYPITSIPISYILSSRNQYTHISICNEILIPSFSYNKTFFLLDMGIG